MVTVEDIDEKLGKAPRHIRAKSITKRAGRA